MSGAPSRWTCELCEKTLPATHKGHHKKYHCPKQGNLQRAIQRQEQAIANEAAREAERLKATEEAKPPPPKFYQYLACVCGCGAQIGQVKGQKKRQFVDNEHYEGWRSDRDREADGTEDGVVAKRKHAEEVAAITEKEAAIASAAGAVRLVSGEASFHLWARCLGFNAGDAVPVAA